MTTDEQRLKRNAYMRAWRKANPEKARANSRRVYAKSKARYARQNKEWRLAHPERVKEYSKLRNRPAADFKAYRAVRKAAGLCVSCVDPATRGELCPRHHEMRNAKLRKGGSRYYSALNLTHKYRARKSGAYVEPVNRVAVFERDAGVCHICSGPVDLRDMLLDHVIPLSKGGKHSYENVKASHARCNQSKGNRPMQPNTVTPIP